MVAIDVPPVTTVRFVGKEFAVSPQVGARTLSRRQLASRRRLVLSLAVAASTVVVGCGGLGPASLVSRAPALGTAVQGSALPDTEHVSGSGSYQTNIAIAVPDGPGAPQVSLTYDSQANASLAGIGWDLSVGYPMLVARDVRFGTPQWKYDADWVWGGTPLVRVNPATCGSLCTYRTAPESLVSVTIDLSLPPFPEGQPAQPLHERASVQMPDGTVLDYEPIYYGQGDYPALPAGAETNVFGFRLASVADHNGYKTCFKYRVPVDQQQQGAQREQGRVAPLSEISWGLSPSGSTATCAGIFANPARHSIRFEYQTPSALGYYASWTLRFGAPTSFDDLLTRIVVTPKQSQQLREEYLLLYYPSNASDTRRPLLAQVLERVPVREPNAVKPTATRTLRSFAYGKRSTQFADAQVIEFAGDPKDVWFPKSLAGSVARPVRRASVFQNPNGMFQAGQDQDSDAAPPTHSITEQWSFLDLNGDGLLDLQWGKETGWDRLWKTFEAGPLDSAVSVAQRPAQQRLIINEGLIPSPVNGVSASLVSSFVNQSSRAPTLETDYRPRSTPRIEDGGPTPTRRKTSWLWGEGRGLTRTGMPMTITAGEAPPAPGTCKRRWPVYPDKTIAVPDNSLYLKIGEKSAINSNSMLAGLPIVAEIFHGIYGGYHPTYGVSATVSGWADVDGDGVPEFVATPSFIDRFKFNLACPTFGLDPTAGIPAFPYTQDASYADEPETATNANNEPETRWFFAGSLDEPGATVPNCAFQPADVVCLKERPGPAGPVGLPISFGTSTGNTEGFGFTLPIGAIYSTLASAAISENWYATAIAAPGLTVATHAPRASGGVRISFPGPMASEFVQAGRSVQGTLQNFGTEAANSNVAGIAGFLISFAKVDLDFTVLSGTTNNRSETRSQLMDINADGLPDYLLYSGGTNIDANCGAGSDSQSKLVAYLNSPAGFGLPGRGPFVINCGFAYPASLQTITDADLAEIDSLVGQVADRVAALVLPPMPDQLCKGSLGPGCPAYVALIEDIASKTDRIVTLSRPYMAVSVDEIDRERALIEETNSLKDAMRGVNDSIIARIPLLAVDLVSVDATTTLARQVGDNLTYIARSLHHINHSSRINVVTEGFSRLGGNQPVESDDNFQPFWEAAFGINAQTRGFLDLNGDGLPDYVLTADRDAEGDDGFCPAGTWKVFWGTGTSSISAGRAFLPQHECVRVPAAPEAVRNYGYETLPLNADLVRREGSGGFSVATTIDSFVTLADMNGDGRPDIIIVGDTWDATSRNETWRVFFNNGRGFDTDPVRRLDIASPATTNANVRAAYCPTAPSLRCGVNVPYPSIRTTLSSNDGTIARDRNDTQASMLDIDGDGNAEMVRRVTLFDSSSGDVTGDGLLVWRRTETGGPQDLLIEERDPVSGSRLQVEYRPSANFQWPDARPDGQAPQLGHHNLAGVSGRLVRSVTTERLIGSAEQRTRRGYDYKLPYYDPKTRISSGFALRTSFALDSRPADARDAQPIDNSVVQTARNSQRPDATGATTHVRNFVRRTGAPVREAINSYAESAPTAACPGIGSTVADPAQPNCAAVGGIRAILSTPSQTVSVEYPSDLKRGALFDLGFDGREPWTDRVARRMPIAAPSRCEPFTDFLSNTVAASAGEATGGAASFANRLPVQCPAPDTNTSPFDFALQYESLYPPNETTPASVSQAAIEAWIKPAATQAEQAVIEQAGAYQLLVKTVNGTPHWSLKVGSAFELISSGADDFIPGEWQHVVATFSPSGARFFVNGRPAGSAAGPAPAVQPNGKLIVGCGLDANGAFERCFDGELGELRVYPEFWQRPPRVTKSDNTVRLPNCTFDAASCPSDFGQLLALRNRNDLATPADDVGTEYKYATPDSLSGGRYRLYGLVSSEAIFVPKPDGTPALYLSYGAHWFDGRPFGQATVGNESQVARFDGTAQATEPTPASLRVKTRSTYGADCPGRPIEVTDPLDSVTRTAWDASCTFPLTVTNALGHTSRTRYYGVEDGLAPLETIRTGAYGTFHLGGRYGQIATVSDVNGATALSTYDEWGRNAARWSSLDRADRPGLRMAYRDALCERKDQNGYVAAVCAQFDVADMRLRSPPVVTTLTWDDQLPRCVAANGTVVDCADASASGFANEQAPGAYRPAYAFGDGQVHALGVNAGKRAWTVSGTADFNALGRMSRAYKIRFLPSACAMGEWCAGSRLTPDPLRSNVAAIQVAYDAQGRAIRNYGPGWPTCDGDPSDQIVAAGKATLKCDQPSAQPKVNDVTRFEYPAPGDVVTIDANNVPALTRRDARGLLTMHQEYLKPPSTAPPGTAPIEYSAVTSVHDALGRLVSTSDQNNNVSLQTYDAMSRLRSTTDPDLGLTTYEYDLRSQLTDQIVASGEKTHNEYDAIGRVTQTDYLRPRSVPGNGPTLQPGSGPTDDQPERPDWQCIKIDLDEPTRFKPGPPGPPPEELQAVQLTTGDLDSGQANTTLPFDFSISTTASMPGGADGPQPGVKEGNYNFPAGAPVVISTDGELLIGGNADGQQAASSVASAKGGARGVLKVLPVDLVLNKEGLRAGVFGTKGQRSFVVEWNGAVAGRSDSGRVLVRAIISEGSPNIRYDYEIVPAQLSVVPSLQLGAGPSLYSRPLFAATDSAPIFSGTAFDLEGLLPGHQAIRFNCGRPHDIGIPFAAGRTRNPVLQLGFRGFAPCDAGAVSSCRNDIQIGYRVAGDPRGDIHPLTSVSYLSRDPAHAGDLDAGIANTLNVALPGDLQGRDFTLVLSPSAKVHSAAETYVLDVIWGGSSSTIYEPEERVHRGYDSAEPPYYLSTGANNSRLEVKPLLDVTFDTPGVIADRSPTHADFTACAPVADPSNSVIGASGKAISLSSHSQCLGTISPARTLRGFTAELWVRSNCGGSAGACAARSILSAGQVFKVGLNTDGRVQCEVGGGTAAIDSDDPLPAEGWAHVALSYDANSRLRCLVNGVSQGTPVTGSIANAALTGIRFGQSVNAPSVIDIDEVRLIDTTRSDADILVDALRPLNVGPPRGNLVHLDFAHPFAPGAQACANVPACKGDLDQSKARNVGILSDGKIVPGILGMAFDTRTARPPGPPVGSPAGKVTIPHSSTLRLANAVTAEVWVKRLDTDTVPLRVIGKWAGAGAPGWRLDVLPSGRLRWEVVAAQTPPGGGNQTLHRSVFITREALDVSWHHVAATYDGARMRVFGDGLPWHRWCGSGPREGTQPDNPGVENCLTPPPPSNCTVESVTVGDQIVADKKRAIGDAECIEGVIDNAMPVLVANDEDSKVLDGLVDEVRVSNYAKREFEVAASARLASAYTQTLGRETSLRNRFIWRDGKQVGPVSNDVPYDLAQQPARELRAYDAQGAVASAIKNVVGQRDPEDHFLARSAIDSLGRNGLIEYPHGEVLVSGVGLDGKQTSLVGYGPFINFQQPVAQSQAYVASAAATITGQPQSATYGNQVRTEWTYDDAAVSGGSSSAPTGAFGPDSLKTVKVTSWTGTLSNLSYDWDAAGNLASVRDTSASHAFRADYTYDDLRRVSSATHWTASQTLAFTYCYDALGNLLLIDGTSSPAPTCYDAQGKPLLKRTDAASVLRAGEGGGLQEYGRALYPPACPNGSNPLPHGLTQRTVLLSGTPSAVVRTGAHCYDAGGRLLWSIDPGADRRYSYFARGKPSSITSDGLRSEYLYDGNGMRVSKAEQGRDTQIIPGPAYRELFDPSPAASAQAPRFEALYAAIARRTGSRPASPVAIPADELVWYSSDHLGGSYFLTNSTGTEVANTRAHYRPFGGYLDPAPQAEDKSGRRQFTSKERDATGLYDFGARGYDPSSGVFTQADNIALGPSPQSLNRYSYVLNNPLGMIDPTGHAGEELSSQVDWVVDPEGGTLPMRRPIPGEVTLHPENYSGQLIASDRVLRETFEYLKQFVRNPQFNGTRFGEPDAYSTATLEQYTHHPSEGVESTGWLIDVVVTAGLAPAARSGAVGLLEAGTRRTAVGEMSYTSQRISSGSRLLDIFGGETGSVSNIKVWIDPKLVGADLVNTTAHENFHVWVAKNYPTWTVSGELPYIGAFPLYAEEVGAYAVGAYRAGQYGQVFLSPLSAFGSLSAGQSLSVLGTTGGAAYGLYYTYGPQRGR